MHETGHKKSGAYPCSSKGWTCGLKRIMAGGRDQGMKKMSASQGRHNYCYIWHKKHGRKWSTYQMKKGMRRGKKKNRGENGMETTIHISGSPLIHHRGGAIPRLARGVIGAAGGIRERGTKGTLRPFIAIDGLRTAMTLCRRKRGESQKEIVLRKSVNIRREGIRLWPKIIYSTLCREKHKKKKQKQRRTVVRSRTQWPFTGSSGFNNELNSSWENPCVRRKSPKSRKEWPERNWKGRVGAEIEWGGDRDNL